MRIGIDAHVLGRKKGGVETYLRSLILALARVDRANTYVLYVTRHHTLDPRALPPRFELRETPVSNPWIQRPLLAYYYRRDRLDVLHVQRALPPLGCRRHVLHVHDVNYRTNPELFRSPGDRAREILFTRSAERARCILTDSEASRQEILRHYRVRPEHVHLAPAGIDHDAFFIDRSPDTVQAVTARYGIAGEYVLYAGALERNKNVHGLVAAYAGLRREPGLERIGLVLTGTPRDARGREYERELRATVSALGLERHVSFAGYVPRADLRRLMSAARLFVFPSFCEGYGLPPLEAMACGVPVIAARIPAVQEVCQDAAVLVDPSDSEGLTAAMARVLTCPSEAERLVARGLRHASQFQWERTAADVLRVYERAVNRDTHIAEEL